MRLRPGRAPKHSPPCASARGRRSRYHIRLHHPDGSRAMLVQTKPPRLYYGWVIVACVWLANFVTVTMNPIVFAFFLDHMVVDLGVSRSTLVWGITIRMISGGLFAPYLGRFVDRHG